MSLPNENRYLHSCADWFAFHLSHVKDLDLNAVESLWPDCEKCQAVYESLHYTSHEGEFGLMTREVLDNVTKVILQYEYCQYRFINYPYL